MLFLIALALMGAVLVLPAGLVTAHQPYCETDDLTLQTAWRIRDVTVSTAFYGTLESAEDVDYFTLSGQAGQRVLLSMAIPRIVGQDSFDPVIALLGPGLPEAQLPLYVERPASSGALVIEPVEAEIFYEPFGQRYYWQRQEEYVTLPADGDYWIAVWHSAGEVGRYTFVYGDREVMGGQYGCNSGEYWTPVGSAGDVAAPGPSLLERLLMLVMRDDDSDHTGHDH